MASLTALVDRLVEYATVFLFNDEKESFSAIVSGTKLSRLTRDDLGGMEIVMVIISDEINQNVEIMIIFVGILISLSCRIWSISSIFQAVKFVSYNWFRILDFYIVFATSDKLIIQSFYTQSKLRGGFHPVILDF